MVGSREKNVYYNEGDEMPLSRYFICSFYFSQGGEMMKESQFQSGLIKELKSRYEGCEVFKMDANYKQGIPDLLILFKKKWAMLENKRSSKASHRPNQDFYVDKFNKMSFARFISPEIKEEVLNELDKAFGIKRNSCTIGSK